MIKLSPQVASVLRTLLKIGGTALASAGVLSADDITSLTRLAQEFFGAAFVLWGMIWSVWAKRSQSTEAKTIAVDVVEKAMGKYSAEPVVARIEAPVTPE